MEPTPLQFKPIKGLEDDDDLFSSNNIEIKLDALLQSPSLKVPLGPTFSMHWLSIEGVQPSIPMNPSTSPEEIVKQEDNGKVQEKPLVRHHLSREQQLYFEHIRKGIQCTKPSEADKTIVRATLKSLSTDSGIHALIPYFSQFIADTVQRNLKHLNLLSNLIRMTKALLLNPSIQLEPYLHQFMPPVLTCVVGNTLCEDLREDHWSLRDLASELVRLVCEKYGQFYPTLQTRITKTLSKAFLDPKRSLRTQYGAIKGLSVLGPHVIRSLLLPNLRLYLELLEPMETSAIQRIEVLRCKGALLEAVGVHVRAVFRDLPYLDLEAVRMDLPETVQASSKQRRSYLVGLSDLREMYGEMLLPHSFPATSDLVYLHL